MCDVRIIKRTDVDWHEWKCEYRPGNKWVWGGNIKAFSNVPPIPVKGYRVRFEPSAYVDLPSYFIVEIAKLMQELEENEGLYKHDTND